MAKRVCSLLVYTNPQKAVRDHVREKYRKTRSELGVNGLFTHNEATQVYINEPGMYQLLVRSKQPFAEQFQDWLYEEVLPSIRKRGSYILPTAPTNPPSVDWLQGRTD